jgi:hypothetical protein
VVIQPPCQHGIVSSKADRCGGSLPEREQAVAGLVNQASHSGARSVGCQAAVFCAATRDWGGATGHETDAELRARAAFSRARSQVNRSGPCRLTLHAHASRLAPARARRAMDGQQACFNRQARRLPCHRRATTPTGWRDGLPHPYTPVVSPAARASDEWAWQVVQRKRRPGGPNAPSRDLWLDHPRLEG